MNSITYYFAASDNTDFKKYLSDKNLSKTRIFILVDTNTRKFCLNKLLTDFSELQLADTILIRNGEQYKTLDTCQVIWKNLTDNFAERGDVLINLGGGVVTDMGGFAASVFKRGMAYCNIPTTLMGMIDAAIGGKTGVDYLGLKNVLGLFAPATKTYIDVDYLKTLPEEHLRSGFSELIKIALVASKPLWDKLQSIEPGTIINHPDIIREAVMVKDGIVKQDPFDKDFRKVLNFGHTIGHAIESYSLTHGKNPLLHGDAVAIGMICETWISNKINGLPDEVMKEIIEKIVASSGKYKLNIEKNELMRMIRNDKKNSSSKINFTLLNAIGDGCIDNHFGEEIIMDALAYYFYL